MRAGAYLLRERNWSITVGTCFALVLAKMGEVFVFRKEGGGKAQSLLECEPTEDSEEVKTLHFIHRKNSPFDHKQKQVTLLKINESVSSSEIILCLKTTNSLFPYHPSQSKTTLTLSARVNIYFAHSDRLNMFLNPSFFASRLMFRTMATGLVGLAPRLRHAVVGIDCLRAIVNTPWL